MTALKKLILRRIAAEGPMPLSDYMAMCLMHPKHGYYQKERVFGKAGDFITAPEVSQMFGEVIGLWLAERWIAMGGPSPVQLIELGPGRGTLMADIWRATRKVPGFHAAASVHFVEASTQLRALQREKMPAAHWHDNLMTVPEGPSLIVANEFFDALPIHQFEKRDGLWFERLVGAEDDTLGFTLGAASAKLALIPDAVKAAPNGSIAEVCPAALTVTSTIAERLKAHGGAALILDYGYARSAPGDTFQALKAHQYTDPFAEPGAADLTAHVAFDRIAETAQEAGLTASAIAEQGTFLMTIGLGARAQQLAAGADDAGQARILSELKRLTAPDEMGQLFKVIALQSPGLTPPPGF
ncbi:class I SAM-dependent methyltransferase [Kordiimonas marina]|uniref:class I SAM-dependent methyltransferase n=1 Tax=Kordiimonas marina TaxID=2872312 RepID=UPI001FF5EB94|nr:SAM-dependent methyltransferase [Kordiimonas marina]MCJ9429703.1 SAM-dependent methyltransferase [Kordiimonas marina]